MGGAFVRRTLLSGMLLTWITTTECCAATSTWKTPTGSLDEDSMSMTGSDLSAIKGVLRSHGKDTVAPKTLIIAPTGAKLPPLNAGGSVSKVLFAGKSELNSSAEETNGNHYVVKNTPQPAKTDNAAHVSISEVESATLPASTPQDTGDADVSNVGGASRVVASKPHLALLEYNTTASNDISDTKANTRDVTVSTIDALGSTQVGPESSTSPVSERSNGNEPPPARVAASAASCLDKNDYYGAVVLLAAIVLLALMPSGVILSRASAVGCPGREENVASGLPNVQQDLDARHNSDSEMGQAPRSTVPAARASAVWDTALSSKIIFTLNFVLWVALAMGFSAYAKGYLRETREPIGLVVLQGTTGMTVLGALRGFGKIELYPTGGYPPGAARLVGLASVMHTGQALLTNFAVILGGVAATNALKAMEPIAAAVFSYFLLGKSCSGSRLASIVIIAAGIIVFTVTSSGAAPGGGGGGAGGEEGDFSNGSIVGISTMIVVAAVCCNALRNVFIKKGEPLPPHQTLFACSVVAAVFGIGMMFLRLMFSIMDDLALVGAERGENTGGSNVSSSSNGAVDWVRVTGVNASLCFVGYNLASFNLLAHLTPVGHAVGNSFKRVLVFAGGLMFLGELMNSRQLGGAALALAGVLAYNVSGTKK